MEAGGGAPDAHAPSHQDGDSDELPLSALDLTLVDDLPILVGTDGLGGLVNDVANGNGRVLYAGDLTYTDPVGLVALSITNLLAEVFNGDTDSLLSFSANGTGASFNLAATAAAGARAQLQGNGVTGVLTVTLAGSAPEAVIGGGRLKVNEKVSIGNAALTANGEVRINPTTGQFNQINGVEEEVLYV